MIVVSALVPFPLEPWVEKSFWLKMLRLFAILVRLLHSMIIMSAMVPFSSWSLSWEKLLVENGEAICSFGEAIAFYDYNISSNPFLFWFLTFLLNQRLGDQGPELDKMYLCYICYMSSHPAIISNWVVGRKSYVLSIYLYLLLSMIMFVSRLQLIIMMAIVFIFIHRTHIH